MTKPNITAIVAITLDGKIADRNGKSQWITGEEVRLHVHQLRNIFDCVMVGGATVVKDNSRLNVRGIPNSRDPIRVALDTNLYISPDAKICKMGTGGQTIIFCSEKAFAFKNNKYPKHVRLMPLEARSDLQQSLELKEVLTVLAKEDILTVLCEGGGRLSSALLRQGLVDEIHWVIAPKIMGDEKAIPAIADAGKVLLDKCWRLDMVSVKQFGSDTLIHGVINTQI